jgi:hypothetical protein
MKKASSIELMIMGTCLIPLALLIDNVFAKSILAAASIVLNIIAVVKSFKEKKEKNS